MKSLTQYIKESAEQQGYKAAVKAQKSFAAKWYKNRDNKEFQKLTNFCKKVFDKNIYAPYEEQEQALSNFVTNSKENNEEFKNIFNDIIEPNFNGNAQRNITIGYSLSNTKNDIFVQAIIFALRHIDEKHNINLLDK